eukprot:gene4217-4913_t
MHVDERLIAKIALAANGDPILSRRFDCLYSGSGSERTTPSISLFRAPTTVPLPSEAVEISKKQNYARFLDGIPLKEFNAEQQRKGFPAELLSFKDTLVFVD